MRVHKALFFTFFFSPKHNALKSFLSLLMTILFQKCAILSLLINLMVIPKKKIILWLPFLSSNYSRALNIGNRDFCWIFFFTHNLNTRNQRVLCIFFAILFFVFFFLTVFLPSNDIFPLMQCAPLRRLHPNVTSTKSIQSIQST